MAEHEDLYAVLGLDRSASEDDLRTAYRRLARQHHPDVNPGNHQAEDKFKRIAAAYEVLSDQEKRKAYDEFGAESLRSGFDPEQARAYRQWREGRARGGQPFGEGFETEGFDFDLSDLSDLFGFGGGPSAPRGPRRGADLRAVVELDLPQAAAGADVHLEVPTTQTCSACHGSGAKAGTTASPCPQCGGSGQRQVARGPMRMVATCTACGGRGSTQPPCPSCHGSGHQSVAQRLTVRIPSGADDGSTLRIAGKGAPGPDGGPPGDLVIETRVRPHPLLRRDGLDLHLKLPVTLDEIYNGAQVEIPTFEGPVKLTIPPRSQPGARLRLRGKGLKRGREQGDLYAELELRLPERHDEQLAEAIRKATAAYAGPVRGEMRL